MGIPSVPELSIILLILVIFFGAKKLPDLGSSLGKGIRGFKKALDHDETSVSKADNKTA